MNRPKSREPLYTLEALEQEIAARRLGSGQKSYSPHEPHPKQREFLGLTCLEALYGGAAGGGKSDALLMAALQYVHVPHYSALILRRTYPDLALPGAIMDRAKEWLIPQGVRWNDTEKRFTFPSGAIITFGYLDTDKDRYRYAGAEFQCLCFDELTQFPELAYTFLLSRLRRTRGINAPLRVRCGSNPGGIGHDWVKTRFIDGANPECVFVPALIADNPSLDAAEYRKSLSLLDSTTRMQLEDGVWVRDAGGLVYRYSPDANNILRLPEAEDWNWVLGLDFGIKDATAYAVLAWRETDPLVYCAECWKESGRPPSEVAATVVELSKRYPFSKIVGDIGGMGKAFEAEMRSRFSVPIVPAEKTNKLGYIGLLNGALEQGEVRVIPQPCAPLVNEWNRLPWADENRQKESPGFDNHCADAFLYAWRACPNYHERAKPPAVDPGTTAYYQSAQERLERLAEERVHDRAGREWWRQ